MATAKHFENTFFPGNGDRQRRKWAYWYSKFTQRIELTLADDPHNEWALNSLEAEVNARSDDPEWAIYIVEVLRPKLPLYSMEAGHAFVFYKRRLSESPMGDSTVLTDWLEVGKEEPEE